MAESPLYTYKATASIASVSAGPHRSLSQWHTSSSTHLPSTVPVTGDSSFGDHIGPSDVHATPGPRLLSVLTTPIFIMLSALVILTIAGIFFIQSKKLQRSDDADAEHGDGKAGRATEGTPPYMGDGHWNASEPSTLRGPPPAYSPTTYNIIPKDTKEDRSWESSAVITPKKQYTPQLSYSPSIKSIGQRHQNYVSANLKNVMPLPDNAGDRKHPQ